MLPLLGQSCEESTEASSRFAKPDRDHLIVDLVNQAVPVFADLVNFLLNVVWNQAKPCN